MREYLEQNLNAIIAIALFLHLYGIGSAGAIHLLFFMFKKGHPFERWLPFIARKLYVRFKHKHEWVLESRRKVYVGLKLKFAHSGTYKVEYYNNAELIASDVIVITNPENDYVNTHPSKEVLIYKQNQQINFNIFEQLLSDDRVEDAKMGRTDKEDYRYMEFAERFIRTYKILGGCLYCTGVRLSAVMSVIMLSLMCSELLYFTPIFILFTYYYLNKYSKT